MKYVPNILTILRLVIIVPFAFALVQKNTHLAFWMCFIAGWTDLLDGLIARVYNLHTRLGAMLDPIADKAFMTVSYILMGIYGYLPLFIVAVVLLREVGIIMGLSFYYALIGKINVAPSLISKLNTLLQVSLVGYVLLNDSYIPMPWLMTDLLMIGVVITSIWSYVIYWRRGFADLRAHREAQRLLNTQNK